MDWVDLHSHVRIRLFNNGFLGQVHLLVDEPYRYDADDDRDADQYSDAYDLRALRGSLVFLLLSYLSL